MMIPRCEDVLTRDIQQTRKLSQRRAFVIIGVTKTQINCVALIIQLRVSCSRPLNKFGNAVHFLVIFRDETFETFGMVK